MKNWKIVLAIVFLILGGIGVILLWLDKLNFIFGSWIPWIFISIGGGLLKSVDFDERQEKYDKMAERAANASDKEKENLSLLRNLVNVAAANGKFEPTEVALIQILMREKGMADDEIVDQMNRFKDNRSDSLIVPNTDEKKREQLGAFCAVMMIDGKATTKEKDVIKKIALKFGYDNDDANFIVNQSIENFKNNEEYQNMREQLKKLTKGQSTIDA